MIWGLNHFSLRLLHQGAFVASSVIIPVFLLLSSGCAIDSNGVGLGVFTSESKPISPDVKYCRFSGFGIYGIDGAVGVGYVDRRVVIADAEGKSYRIKTPIVEFAVGPAAESSGAVQWLLEE